MAIDRNLLNLYLQNDPLKNIYNLDPSVIKSYAQDITPGAKEVQLGSMGYTRPYGDDPNLYIGNLDKFASPRGPLYGTTPMDKDWLDKPLKGKKTTVDNLPITRNITNRELITRDLNAPAGSFDQQQALADVFGFHHPGAGYQGATWRETLDERNKQIAETIGHEARHQILGKNPEFYQSINLGPYKPEFKSKHEYLNRMLDFQAYNNPRIYKDIYKGIHGDMPRHLYSPVADEFSDQATAFTNKMKARRKMLMDIRKRQGAQHQGILEAAGTELMGAGPEIADRRAPLQALVTALANKEARERVSRGEARDYGKTETRASSGWESSPFAKGGLVDLYRHGGFSG
jgi:hypothetical protein